MSMFSIQLPPYGGNNMPSQREIAEKGPASNTTTAQQIDAGKKMTERTGYVESQVVQNPNANK